MAGQNGVGEPTLEDVLQDVSRFAVEPRGGQLLQDAIGESEAQREAVLKAVLPEASRLSMDASGNAVVGLLFDTVTPEHRVQLADQLRGSVHALANDKHGCRVVQKALQLLPEDALPAFTEQLEVSVVSCSESPHGNHVMQWCVEHMPEDFIDLVIGSLEDVALDMAVHVYGCRVLQRLVERCCKLDALDKLDPILGKITGGTRTIAQDKNGNYVLQCVLEHGRLEDLRQILEALQSNVVEIACNKFGSNVIEKFFATMAAEGDDRALALAQERHDLVLAMLGDPEFTSSPLQAMIEDKFGNFAVQALVKHCVDRDKELVREHLVHVAPKIGGLFRGQILATLSTEFELDDTSVLGPCIGDDDKNDVDVGEKKDEEQAAPAENKQGVMENQWVDHKTIPAELRIFVGGIPAHLSNDGLRDYFAQFGTVKDAHIKRLSGTGQSRGFGFVAFESEDVVEAVLTKQDGHRIDGKWIEAKRIQPEVPRGKRTAEEAWGRPQEAGVADDRKTRARAETRKPWGQDTCDLTGAESDCKVFVGGLPKSCTAEVLKGYFGVYGEISDAVIMRDPSTGVHRGFGFVTFDSVDAIESVIEQYSNHRLYGKWIEVKRAVGGQQETKPLEPPSGPWKRRQGQAKDGGGPEANGVEEKDSRGLASASNKIFVGGLPQGCTSAKLNEYFSGYGEVVDAVVMTEPNSGKSRGFGYVTFGNVQAADAVIEAYADHLFDGRWVEVKRVDGPSHCKLELRGEEGEPHAQEGTIEEADADDRRHSGACADDCKVFVGGLPKTCSNDALAEYFGAYGEIVDAVVMMDPQTGNPRGFGFVRFEVADSVDAVIAEYENHRIVGKWIEVKRVDGRLRTSSGGKGTAWQERKGWSGQGWHKGFARGGYRQFGR